MRETPIAAGAAFVFLGDPDSRRPRGRAGSVLLRAVGWDEGVR
jgi:hypothetical protein